MTIAWDVYESPLGPLTIAAGPSGVTTLSFPGAARSEWDERDRDSAALADAVAQLDAYFAGERRAFDLALDLRGTPFQRRVWAELRRLPYGATVTYTELASAVGRPDVGRARAAGRGPGGGRAAAGAGGRTPVPIVVPCHRVVGAGGALTGYGGGLHRKGALL